MNTKEILDWVYTAKPQLGDRNMDPSEAEIQLVKELVHEELNETLEAIKNNDKKETLDGIVDLIWVVFNIAAICGLTHEEILNYSERVLESNYSKFCDTEQEAIDTIFMYGMGTHPDKKLEQIETYFREVGNKYVIFRSSDNKIMKSYKYNKL